MVEMITKTTLCERQSFRVNPGHDGDKVCSKTGDVTLENYFISQYNLGNADIHSVSGHGN